MTTKLSSVDKEIMVWISNHTAGFTAREISKELNISSTAVGARLRSLRQDGRIKKNRICKTRNRRAKNLGGKVMMPRKVEYAEAWNWIRAYEMPEFTAADLAKGMGITPSKTAGILNSLKRRGLIETTGRVKGSPASVWKAK